MNCYKMNSTFIPNLLLLVLVEYILKITVVVAWNQKNVQGAEQRDRGSLVCTSPVLLSRAWQISALLKVLSGKNKRI
jgi:hypothetical protein